MFLIHHLVGRASELEKDSKDLRESFGCMVSLRAAEAVRDPILA